MDRIGSTRSSNFFMIDLEGREVLIILQNPNFLAQLIMEGIRLGMENYTNQVWLKNIMNPLDPSISPTLFNHMQQMWNLPNHFNPLLTAVREDLPFFTPLEQSLENSLFNPWMAHPTFTLIPPNTLVEDEVIEDAMEEVQTPSFTEIANLKGVTLILFQEMEDKNYIFISPLNLIKKCSIVFCPIFTAQIAKMVVVLSSILRT